MAAGAKSVPPLSARRWQRWRLCLAQWPLQNRRRDSGAASPIWFEKNRGATGPWALLPWTTAGILAIVLASVTLTGRATQRDRESLAKLEQALSVLNDPEAKDVSFGDPKASGRVLVGPSRGVVLIAAHLPKLEPDRIFQMWVIPTQGNPIPAGTFAGDVNDTAVYVRTGAITGAAAIAVTVEPAGGSPQPTTTPFIVTKL